VPIDELAYGFLRDAMACIGWLNMTPAGPFPDDMVLEMTGTRFGFPEIRPPSLRSRVVQ
jgi:hypothetical protein